MTSSNTVASSAATGTGCGPNTINYILGITKVYTTRVGEGPFPTELKDKIGKHLGTKGKEFGTVLAEKEDVVGLMVFWLDKQLKFLELMELL